MEADALVALLIIVLAGAAIASLAHAATVAASRAATSASGTMERGNESAQTLLEAALR